MDVYIQVGISFIAMGIFAHLARLTRSFFVPFYILAGIIMGPFFLNIVTRVEVISIFADIGIVFLLFYLGFEFSFNRLFDNKVVLSKAGTIDFLINFSVGLLGGCLLGFDIVHSIAFAGIIYMSSSGIITKTLVQLKAIDDPEGELVMGIMIFEDLIMVIFLVFVSSFFDISNDSNWMLISFSVFKAIAFSSVLLVIGRKFNGIFDYILKSNSQEILYLSFLSVIFAVTILGMQLGVSKALVAFFLGLAFGESKSSEKVESLAIQFRDIFGSLYFFYFGLRFQLSNFNVSMGIILGVLILAVLGKMVSSLLVSQTLEHSFQRGFLMGIITISRGEFSLIIAAIIGDEIFNFEAFSVMLILFTTFISTMGFKVSKYFCAEKDLCILPEVHIERKLFNK